MKIPQPIMLNEIYRSFEDKFRGSEELIRNRHLNYANFFLAISSERPGSSIFDAGCGRGEWIDLMASHDFNCLGVDINPKMINNYQNFIKVGNALEEIKILKKESQVIVSSFHMVEHLQPCEIHEFIQDSFNVLEPGGILIIETPNIENLNIGCNSFWLDPTHIRPVNMLFLEFLCKEIGFHKTLIARFNENPSLVTNSRLSLNDVLFNVSPDIALVAQKGPADAALVKILSKAFTIKYGFSLQELSNLYDQSISKKSILNLWLSRILKKKINNLRIKLKNLVKN